jgi:putative RecB family exonuclease
MRPFSHSRLQALADCPRRYRLRYVDRIVEAFQTVEAFVGSLVHEALQWAYMERESRSAPSADDVLERYDSAWRSRMGPGIRVVVDGRRPEEYREEGAAMLRRHVAGTFAADRMETLAVEPKVELQVRGAAYVGYVDRLARANGMLHVIDYKTGRSVPDSIEAAGLQARGYGVAVLERHGGLEVGIRYEYLRQGRVLEETFPRSASAAVAEAIGVRIEAAQAAERAGDFPARPGPLCRWCGYRDTCDASPFRLLVPGPAARVEPPPRASAPPAAEAAGAPVPGRCPRCGSPMRRRAGSRGEMIACERYPDCR